jgi:hypothetical protein
MTTYVRLDCNPRFKSSVINKMTALHASFTCKCAASGLSVAQLMADNHAVGFCSALPLQTSNENGQLFSVFEFIPKRKKGNRAAAPRSFQRTRTENGPACTRQIISFTVRIIFKNECTFNYQQGRAGTCCSAHKTG